MRYIWLLLLLSSSAIADELKFRFKSPSFTGIGYSAHKINLENISAARKKTIKDELKSLSITYSLEFIQSSLNRLQNNYLLTPGLILGPLISMVTLFRGIS